MINSAEFDAALQLIADYKMQLEKGLNKNLSNRTINLEQNITNGTYIALRNYYKKEYGIGLDWNDLEIMDIKLLAAIDFDKLLHTRGFGRIALFNFKKLLVFNAVISKEALNK
jgi:hypothetical protein